MHEANTGGHKGRPYIDLRRFAVAAAIVLVAWIPTPSGLGPVGQSLGPAHAQEETPTEILRWLSRVRWWRQPPGGPTEVAVDAVPAGSLTVTWQAPETLAFDILHYDVQYRVQGSGDFLTRTGDGPATQVVLDGLAETTTYEVRVRAVTELGFGDWSATSTGTTVRATVRFEEGESATRQVAENTPGDQAIGAPFVATGAGALQYALDGPDAAAFGIDADSGQLRTREGVVYDHEATPRYAFTVTASDPMGGMASLAATVTVTDVDEPPGVPDAPRTEVASPTRMTLRWDAPENTGPPIEDYDLEYRGAGQAFADAGHQGPGTTTEIEQLDRDTRYTFRVRGRNAEGIGPWSPHGTGRTTRRGTEGGSTTALDELPQVSPVFLPAGATATAGGRVETFRAQGAFRDPQDDVLYFEASSANPSIARASFDGAVVAVRPRRVGRATIAVIASDPQDDAVVGTFDIDVREPDVPDPEVTVDDTGDTLTLIFNDAFGPDERHAYEFALRQKTPRGGWRRGCIDTHNPNATGGSFRVAAEIDVAGVLEPGNDYEVVYRRAGYLCVVARPTGVWSRVAEVTAPGPVAFDLDLVFVDSAPSTHHGAIRAAADEWRQILRTSLPDLDFSTQPFAADTCVEGQERVTDTIDDLRVFVRLAPIDGAGGTLATARTCVFRLASGLPILSAMTFDTDDLDALSTAENERVAMHELAHALGFGTLWYRHSLVRYPSRDAAGDPVDEDRDTHFTGALALAAFDEAGGTAYAGRPVPAENTGGPGSRDGHWRESVFGAELLSPRVAPGQIEPLSAITLQALADMGYRVDASRAEPYALPGLAPTFAPPTGETDATAPGHCVVLPGGTPVDDGPPLIVLPDRVTVRPLPPR
ncbi:MAG: fibronectin type III domain-containing protein [Gammaproteobacteria bacterium]|nr:fibronectin type III domain-containing protein [Gammaproteobacteria bacterium]